MSFRSVILLSLFWISISWPNYTNAENPTNLQFLHCISNYVIPFSATSDYVYTPNTTVYSSLIFSPHNPRCSTLTSQKPVAVVRPRLESQIRPAVLCSRKHRLHVRIRSGGHDYEGLSYLCKTPFIIIDMRHLRAVDVDIGHATAWVQSGATLGELYYKISRKSATHGFPAGLCPTVGVGGHFTGGGLGTLMRKYGLAADNVVDARLVDVNGRILDRKTMGEDLFWAIRGGGASSFAFVVSWKIKLVNVPPVVTAFNVRKNLDGENIKLLHRWQGVAASIDSNLFIRIIMEHTGNTQGVQATFNSLFLGRIHDLIPLMNKSFPELGLTAGDCTEMSWIDSVLYFAGYPIAQSPEVLLRNTDIYVSYFKAKSDFVTEPIPQHVLERIRDRFLEEKIVIMIMDPFGGKMGEIPETETPFPHRKGNLYNNQYLIKWEADGVRASNQHIHWIRDLYRFMAPYVSRRPRRAYVNYRDLDLGTNRPQGDTSFMESSVWGEKYFNGNFERLAQVKSRVDPENFFRSEQSIPPFMKFS